MSKKFYAVNRETGERWKPSRKGEFLMMYDSGYLAVVGGSDWGGMFVSPLCTKTWRVVFKLKES